MLLSSRQRRGRSARVRQLWLGLAKWVGVVALLAGASLYAYQTGLKSGVAERDEINVKYADARQQIARLTGQVRALNDRIAKAPGNLLAAYMTADQVNGLVAQVKARLDAGVKPDRLTAAIGAAQNDRVCLATQSRRIVVATPTIGPPGTAGNFAAEQIQVTAKGENAQDENNAPEAWYDPEKPVTITIVHGNDAPTEVQGAMPLEKSLTIGGRQLNFGFARDRQGLLTVRLDDCVP